MRLNLLVLSMKLNRLVLSNEIEMSMRLRL